MPERGWVATCPVCKWSALVFSKEGAEAAKLAHERMSKHRGVTAQPAAGIATSVSPSAGSNSLKQPA